jgi:hypothetical protein
MPKCPFCGRVLADAWIQRQGASLMGKARGPSKARANASQAAHTRWERARAIYASLKFKTSFEFVPIACVDADVRLGRFR